MRVHVSEDSAGSFSKVLEVEGVEVSVGGDPGADVEVWVEGSPRGEVMAGLGGLRGLVVPWAGVGGELVRAVREYEGRGRELAVFNIHHNAGATAETAVALLMAVARRLVVLDGETRRGDWGSRVDGAGCFGLEGKRGVVVGYGEIGRRVGRVLGALGMEVLGVRRREGEGVVDGVRVVGSEGLDGALSGADVVVLCVPGTGEARGMIEGGRLGLLAEGAILVNVGRGSVVEEGALFEALRSGRLFGAGLDVWWRYPHGEGRSGVVGEFDWASLPNVVMSPHVGGSDDSSELRRWEAVGGVLQRLMEGDWTTGRVDLDRGY